MMSGRKDLWIKKAYVNVKKSEIDSIKHKEKGIYNLNEVNIDGKKYVVDGKNVILDHSEDEINIANWIVNNIGGEVYLYPRIVMPKGIRTPDYIWNDEKWDLKTINSHGKNTLTTAVKNTKNQSNNLILDLINDEYTDEEILKNMDRIYLNKTYRFLNRIIIKEGNKLRFFFERNKIK